MHRIQLDCNTECNHVLEVILVAAFRRRIRSAGAGAGFWKNYVLFSGGVET